VVDDALKAADDAYDLLEHGLTGFGSAAPGLA